MANRNLENGNGAEEDSDEGGIQTVLTESVLENLRALQGKMLTSLTLWEDSLAYGDEEEAVPEAERVFFDCDLYFADRQLLEVYGASAYFDPDGGPLEGIEAITDALGELAEGGNVVAEVGSDAEDGLVLVFAVEDEATLIMAVSGWVLSTWDELPDYEE